MSDMKQGHHLQGRPDADSNKWDYVPHGKLAAWQALEAHYPKVRELHLRKLFADDPKRGECMTAEAVGIYVDYSKPPTAEK